MAEPGKRYLGDAVYAEWEDQWPGPTLVLTTEDGIRATNRIVLEPEVLQALYKFVEARRKKGKG